MWPCSCVPPPKRRPDSRRGAWLWGCPCAYLMPPCWAFAGAVWAAVREALGPIERFMRPPQRAWVRPGGCAAGS
eukprot:9071829-Alexandrium_andersonii.AAC.1